MPAARARLHRIVTALPAVLEPNALYFVRRGDGFDLHATNALGVVVSYALNVPKVFVSSGQLSSPRFYLGSALTNAQGVWTIDLTPAGFTNTPFVQAQAISKSGAITGQAQATVQSRTTTSASGAVTLPLGTILLSAAALQFAPAGYSVDVMAVGF